MIDFLFHTIILLELAILSKDSSNLNLDIETINKMKLTLVNKLI